MNSLSPELLSHILTFLPDNTLHTYATISRPFQFAIERHTFSTITFHSSSLPLFTSAFSPPHRRATLASLEFHILLPAHSDPSEDSDTSEDSATTEDRAASEDNAAFTSATTSLLAHLSTWSSGRGIKLEMKAYSDTDRDENPHPFLSLHPASSIPSVPRITRLDIISPRRISGAAVAAITAHLPCLQEAEWFLSDEEPGRLQHRGGL
jgi:hypothetical protein